MKPDSKDYILYDPMDVTFWERQNYREQLSNCQELRIGKDLTTWSEAVWWRKGP